MLYLFCSFFFLNAYKGCWKPPCPFQPKKDFKKIIPVFGHLIRFWEIGWIKEFSSHPSPHVGSLVQCWVFSVHSISQDNGNYLPVSISSLTCNRLYRVNVAKSNKGSLIWYIIECLYNAEGLQTALCLETSIFLISVKGTQGVPTNVWTLCDGSIVHALRPPFI